MEIVRVIDITYHVFYGVEIGYLINQSNLYSININNKQKVSISNAQTSAYLNKSIGKVINVIAPRQKEVNLLLLNNVEIFLNKNRVLSCRVRILDYTVNLQSISKYNVTSLISEKYFTNTKLQNLFTVDSSVSYRYKVETKILE